MLSFWLLCGMLLSSAYTSNLLANLVSVELEKTVDTVDQMVERGHLVHHETVPFVFHFSFAVLV